MPPTKTPSRRLRGCEHADNMMVAYCSGAPGTRSHLSTSWCPDCGALGQTSRTGTSWTIPHGRASARRERV